MARFLVHALPCLATVAGDAKPVRAAVVWFVLLLAVLGLFVLGVAILTLSRMLRRTGKKPELPASPVDPWAEAGRRLAMDDKGASE